MPRVMAQRSRATDQGPPASHELSSELIRLLNRFAGPGRGANRNQRATAFGPHLLTSLDRAISAWRTAQREARGLLERGKSNTIMYGMNRYPCSWPQGQQLMPISRR